MANLKGILFFPARNTPTLSALCIVDCAHHFVMSLSPSGNGVNADDLCAHCDDHVYQHYGAFAMPVLPQDALYAAVTARSPAYQKAHANAPSGTSAAPSGTSAAPSGTSAVVYGTLPRSEWRQLSVSSCHTCSALWCTSSHTAKGCRINELCSMCTTVFNHSPCALIGAAIGASERFQIDKHRALLLLNTAPRPPLNDYVEVSQVDWNSAGLGKCTPACVGWWVITNPAVPRFGCHTKYLCNNCEAAVFGINVKFMGINIGTSEIAAIDAHSNARQSSIGWIPSWYNQGSAALQGATRHPIKDGTWGSCDCGSSSSDPTHYTWCKSNG